MTKLNLRTAIAAVALAGIAPALTGAAPGPPQGGGPAQ